jgi:LysM repeat protein
LNLQWTFTAAHRGDCALYVSYDVSATRANQRWFKIANLPRCKDDNNKDVAVKIPAFLKNGHAVFRWDWYALHIWPGAEFYSQCFDAMVSGGKATLASDVNQYKLIGPALYPANANEVLASGAKGYRNPFPPSETTDFYMTGPPCAKAMTDNNCEMTKQGSKGHISVGTTGTGGDTGSGTTPATAAPVTPVTPDQRNCLTHKVVTGESLSGIAAKYNAEGKVVTWQQICSYNGKSDCNAIYPGNDLIIPYKGSKCDASATPAPVTASPAGDNNAGAFTVGVFITAMFSAFLL